MFKYVNIDEFSDIMYQYPFAKVHTLVFYLCEMEEKDRSFNEIEKEWIKNIKEYQRKFEKCWKCIQHIIIQRGYFRTWKNMVQILNKMFPHIFIEFIKYKIPCEGLDGSCSPYHSFKAFKATIGRPKEYH